MTDHKFTDDEIIKALEVCGTDEQPCSMCPLWQICGDGRMTSTHFALALINRQKYEIESLNAVHADMTESLRLASEANKDMQAEIERLQKYNTDVAFKHYNDGIKEFVQRLKENETKSCSWCVHSKHGTRSEKCDNFFPTHQRAYCLNYDRWESKIDTVVKEMTETK